MLIPYSQQSKEESHTEKLTEMLSDFQDESLTLRSSSNLESVEDGRQLVGELNIHNSTDNSDNLSLAHFRGKGSDGVGVVT